MAEYNTCQIRPPCEFRQLVLYQIFLLLISIIFNLLPPPSQARLSRDFVFHAVRVHHGRVNVLFHPSICFIALVMHPAIAYLSCTVTTSHTHICSCRRTHIRRAHLGKHSSGEVINQFYGFLWEPFLTPIKRLPSFPPRLSLSLSHSLVYISICISFASHLRTIHPQPISFNRFFPILRRDNWRKSLVKSSPLDDTR